MPLRFLFDEHLRGWPFRIIQRHNARGLNPIEVVCVGDENTPKLSSQDRELLAWAEGAGRILVTRDERTMPAHLQGHLADDHHSPGVFILRNVFFSQILEFLVLAAYASQPDEWIDRVSFVP